jgi:hypothetical protein
MNSYDLTDEQRRARARHFASESPNRIPMTNELPVSLCMEAVLARTVDVAVALVGGEVFSNGVRFNTLVVARPDWIHSVDPIGSQGLEGLWDLVNGTIDDGGFSSVSGQQLQLRLEFADGRTVRNQRPWRDQPTEALEEDIPTLEKQGGGGGGAFEYRGSYWLTPLPPPGDLTVSCTWPAVDIPETVTVLDATAIKDAARRVVPLWPWEPRFGFPASPGEEPSARRRDWVARAFRRNG